MLVMFGSSTCTSLSLLCKPQLVKRNYCKAIKITVPLNLVKLVYEVKSLKFFKSSEDKMAALEASANYAQNRLC